MTHSWDIIIWKQENGIDYVPSCWANSDKTVYKYPLDISETKTRQLIYECKDINKNYEMCAAICKIANVTDLEKAKYYCQKGQVTSNMETSSDDEGKNTVKNRSGRSIRKPKKLYVVSSSDSNSENAAVEKTISTKKNEGKKKLNKDGTPFKKISFQVPAASSIEKGAVEGTVDTSLKTTASCSGNLISSTLNRSTTQVDTSGPVAVYRGSDDTHHHDKQMNKIIDKLNSLQFDVGEMKKTLHRLENLISLKITPVRNVGPNEDKDDDDNLITLLPCNTHEDVLKVEEMIKNKNSMQQLIHTLHLLGGDDPHKSVYLMMSKLLSRTAALEYSALGKQKKKAFVSLKMYEALIIAVRKRYPTVTTQKLKESVGVYLATAKSRLPKVRVIINDADEAHETEVQDE